MAFMSIQAQGQDVQALRAKEIPASKKVEVQDTYFGNVVSDPYRWLEDDLSEETATWVNRQNEHTDFYLNQIPFRKVIKAMLTSMWNYPKQGIPSVKGKYYVTYKNDGLQNQSVLYIQEGVDGKESVLLDPNSLNDKGTSSLGVVSFSKKQKYVAYAVSNAGSDWQDIYVMDVQSKQVLRDTIRYSKFSGLSWKGDEGFFYSGYDKPKEGSSKYSAKTEYQKIFFHKVGTSQAEDILIYEDKEHPLRYKGALFTDDGKYIIISLSEGTDGTELLYSEAGKLDFKVLCKGFEHNYDFVDMVEGKFVVVSNRNAPNYQVFVIDPANPDMKNWKVLIKEKEFKLDVLSRVGDKLIASYLVNAASQIDVFSLQGRYLYSIDLPGIGSVGGFEGDASSTHTFYSFTSFNEPTAVYRYDVKTNKSSLHFKTAFPHALDNTIVEQKWFVSKDGTRVPMFIYRRKDIDMKSGQNPVFLYGYGGFNISLTPSFSVPMSLYVQHGGVYVMVNLRGGSEFGEAWHKGGMLSQKQNVFDDFIGAAEYLIQQGVTNKERIAIHGRSNGGLLVGACMTQRPDLFKVALPGVGVLDMLRYHKFTVGWGWAVEYGSSDKEEDFNYLIKYSPLHNVKQGESYPATLITTADHDDRVVPAHSFKFAATLQEKHKGVNPVLIRIDKQAGHGAGKPISKQIEEWADVLSFTMYHTGIKVKH